MFRSEAVKIACGGATLHGILEVPNNSVERAVLIVVGGPQYRVGSHRQFALLSRHLASNGFPSMRFDHRGIGDSDGETTFETLNPDINAAVTKLCAILPSIREVVLWGLCDGASAAMMYAATDPRIKGLVLVNPWFRGEQSQAQTFLKEYYVAQFFSGSFWRRLATGKLNVMQSTISLLRNLKLAIKTKQSLEKSSTAGHVSPDLPFQIRMELGLSDFEGNVLFIMSGKDLTAAEFKQQVNKSKNWQKILARNSVRWLEHEESNHTFSRQEWRQQVENWTSNWLSSW